LRGLPQVDHWWTGKLSSNQSKLSNPPPCSICAETRGLAEHLIEVALAADYLGNTSNYKSELGVAKVKTETIGDWLRLAAQLEKVEVNTWKFESSDAGLYCGTVADNIDAHAEHYTTHATALTRFMFVCNGLEEAYRFIDHLYGPLSARKGVAKGKLKKASSLRAVALLDDLFERKGGRQRRLGTLSTTAATSSGSSIDTELNIAPLWAESTLAQRAD